MITFQRFCITFCALYLFCGARLLEDYRAKRIVGSYSLTSKTWPQVINESGGDLFSQPENTLEILHSVRTKPLYYSKIIGIRKENST